MTSGGSGRLDAYATSTCIKNKKEEEELFSITCIVRRSSLFHMVAPPIIIRLFFSSDEVPTVFFTSSRTVPSVRTINRAKKIRKVIPTVDYEVLSMKFSFFFF